MSWFSILPYDLKHELDYYRCFQLRDIVNEQFKNCTSHIYGPSRKPMMKTVEEAKSMLFMPTIKTDLILLEPHFECYEIFLKIEDLMTFDKLVILFNHIFNLGTENTIIHSLYCKLLNFLQYLNNKLSENRYTERFVIFPYKYEHKIVLFDNYLLEKK